MTPLTLRTHIMVMTLFKYSPIPIAALILYLSRGIPIPLWCFISFVSLFVFSVALDIDLASQFNSNCESQQLSHG